MLRATITSEGKITLPKPLRESPTKSNFGSSHLVADDARPAAHVAQMIQSETDAGNTILIPDLV